MPCVEALRLQAWFDGELDAVAAADIERHTEGCSECRALLTDLTGTRRLIRDRLTFGAASPALRERVTRMLDQEMPAPIRRPDLARQAAWRTRPFWFGALGGVTAAAAAATIGFLLLSARVPDVFLDELVAAHVRSLMPTHLTDVVSTSQHTVKPWFAGHADVSPVVADFAPQGYTLVGGRADYIEGKRVAVVVYEHGPHVINVFSWAGGPASSRLTTRNGYHVVFWKAGNLDYGAVSDAGWEELQGLVRLLRERSEQDARE
ncbi:MAG: anti-sigma factor family protein [Steroidobacterales bacterium]|jgi:anti-sigma factor RsiW